MMEQLLQRFAEGLESSDLTITYSDMHGLWGGVTVILAANGAYERIERKRGAAAPHALRSTLAIARVRDLVRLLHQISAWEQRTPERPPVPDESRATLTLRAGAVEASIWEWFNDLAKNDRLLRVRSLLIELAEADAV